MSAGAERLGKPHLRASPDPIVGRHGEAQSVPGHPDAGRGEGVAARADPLPAGVLDLPAVAAELDSGADVT
ncbi:hypothetical protein, partial [Pseudonocardia bannensis]|uniref:hypothetical protein n=1 Tax=Pseudonocardia bannensis TaxID=630973 RepID=UPI001B7D0E45